MIAWCIVACLYALGFVQVRVLCEVFDSRHESEAFEAWLLSIVWPLTSIMFIVVLVTQTIVAAARRLAS